MKKNIFLFLLLAFISTSIFAQSDDVAAAVEQLRLAMVSGDSAQLDKIASDKLWYGHSSGKQQNKAEFIQSFTTGASDFVSIDLTNQEINVAGKTAIVRHMLDAKTNDNGKPGSVKLLIMTTWIKQHGKWILLARQAVKPPATN